MFSKEATKKGDKRKMTKTRAKAIKLYWNIAKERCPFHEEEMINSFLEGFIDCAEYLLLQNTELEKENAELKEQCSILADCNTCTSACKTENIEMKNNLTKAKELLKKVLDLKKIVTKAEEYLLLEEAEQFLKENA